LPAKHVVASCTRNDRSYSSIDNTNEVLFHFVDIEPPDDTGRFT